MIYKSSLNHKGNRATFKVFFGVFGNSLPSVRGFSFPPFDPPAPVPPPPLERHIWLISSSFSTIQLSVGAQIVGIQFLFGHEIQRNALQKFADLWDTKCSVTGLAALSVPVISIINLLKETHKERVFSKEPAVTKAVVWKKEFRKVILFGFFVV